MQDQGKTLIEQSELYKLLVESVKDYGIFLLNPKGVIISWNKGAENLKGYKANEIIGKHFSIFYTSEKVEEGFPQYELEMAEKEGSFEDEGWRLKKDGSRFWANVVLTALKDDAGVLIGFSKVTRDLTERKQAEEKLRLSEERYRLLVYGVKDYGIFMLSPKGIIETWNEGAEKVKGYRAKEVIGKHFSIFYPKEKNEVGFPQYELEMAGKEGRFEDEGWRIKKDGSRFWANVVITALKNNAGELVGFSKVTRDLTERKQAEEKLRLSEERYRLLISGVKDYGIFRLSPNGIIETWNEGAERLKGYKDKEIVGKHFSIFYPKEKVEEGFPQYELEMAEKEGRFEDEGWRIKKDGSRFWANVVITALRDEKGELAGFSKVTRDLTERKKAEDQLLEFSQKLERQIKTNRELKEFTFIVSHDLKSPLRTIGTLSDFLILDYKDKIDEEGQQQLRWIKEKAVFLDNLINSILSYSKIGSSQSKETELDLNHLVNDIIKGIEVPPNIKISIENTLPEIYAEPHPLYQVFFNLISNAVKFIDKPQGSIQLGSTDEGDHYQFYVRDNGIGIAESNYEKVFSIFQSIPSGDQSQKSTGIGLAIVDKIIRMYGGKVWIDSKIGNYTTFYFTLPKSK